MDSYTVIHIVDRYGSIIMLRINNKTCKIILERLAYFCFFQYLPLCTMFDCHRTVALGMSLRFYS